MNGVIVARTLLTAVIIGGSLISDQHFAHSAEPSHATEKKEDSTAQILSTEFREAADRATPGLVTIYTMRGPHETAEWRRLESRRGKKHPSLQETSPAVSYPNESSPDEQGSGIVVNSQGLILTCHHVVAGADVVFVVLPDGRRFEPVEVYADPEADLALLRIEGAGELAPVRLGNSDELEIGDWVVSLGNPYELKRSVSAGIVSAMDRWVPGIPRPMIQNDAATNPGSSGGALLNLDGEVIGIITGGFSSRKEFQGIGLAIPVNQAKEFISSLNNEAPPLQAYLGCQTQKLPPDLAKQLELPVAGGLYVKDVEEGSPASIGGISEGDIITHFDGQPIDESFRPEQLFDQPRPGEKHGFTVLRDGTSIAVEIEMTSYPLERTNTQISANVHAETSCEYFDKSLGLGLATLTQDVARELRIPLDQKGALVTEVAIGSPAYKEGLAAGMVVVRYNRHATVDPKSYEVAVSNEQAGVPVLMLIRSDKGKHLVVFEVP
ncbi:trypsin-like peptidase domain-containing protein [Adhaeretor mobilis]|uniref:Probable periplasmic serine endoprotease DegP-like n=1 Tax=Adhaeretor mobilis TaxID=1930276 RepID=A0A517MQB9_9BACT|nr:trypsin-like peptidase domain-containing protein [Adhaeretor mobilis]QDS97062.1 putative periplasmic serine endoprotease DegP-like precursor [Adhaeretor mobilis]